MSYKINKPYTDKQKDDFIADYGQDCHGHRGYMMQIVQTEDALWALEPDEIMIDGIPSKDPDHAQKLQKEELERLRQQKLNENEQKRQVEYITTSLGKLKTQTPLGDLKSALILYDKAAKANNGLPEGAVRLYDNNNNIILSPKITYDEFNALTLEITMQYLAIDAKSTEYAKKIIEAKTLKELEGIEIEYGETKQTDSQDGGIDAEGT